MKARELIALLQVARPDAEIDVIQPRRWVKKQPDRTRTKLLSVTVWHDGRIVRFETM